MTATLVPPSVPTLPENSRLLEACRAASAAESEYATKAVIAGFALLEFRDGLRTSHRGKGGTNERPVPIHHNQNTSSTVFLRWLEDNHLSRSGAYRWMNAAERVARLQLNLPMAHDFAPFIEVEGTRVPMSEAFAPGSKACEQFPEVKKFRQNVFDFMADKSLAEAARAAIEGESPAHRITRAGNGKVEGGTRGEDRCAWHDFIGERLREICGHLARWRRFSSKQKETTQEHFENAIEKWPTPLLESLAKSIKTVLQRR